MDKIYEEQIQIAKERVRVIDQTTSMHFRLSDKYKAYAKLEDIVEIIVSVLLCGLTFFDYDKYFNIPANTIMLITGLVSIFLFAFTLIKQAIGHKKLYEKHMLAGKIYAKAKRELKTKINQWESGVQEDIISILDEKSKSLEELPQIPEKQFIRLKHAHKAKVAFSKFLDEHPNDFWIICKIKFRFNCK